MLPDAPLAVDFSPSAADYARHRPGFPDAFFAHVRAHGVGLAGQRILDLGTGTGTLARGFAAQGSDTVGLDPARAMLAEARDLARAAGLEVRWVEARAEATGLPSASFDVVCAGQCWHWFDRPRAAEEVARLLRPGGRALIAYFSYLPEPGSAAAATEELILCDNPGWVWAGHDGRHPGCIDDLAAAGLRYARTFDFELPVAFSHEAWRGRFRACNGVLALEPEARAAFDADLACLLAERFPEPVIANHRVWGVEAEKAAEG